MFSKYKKPNAAGAKPAKAGAPSGPKINVAPVAVAPVDDQKQSLLKARPTKKVGEPGAMDKEKRRKAVSYTHLTLPTILLV